eukprot:1811263-Pleurochrysis_carterae.AAC.1
MHAAGRGFGRVFPTRFPRFSSCPCVASGGALFRATRIARASRSASSPSRASCLQDALSCRRGSEAGASGRAYNPEIALT